MNLLELILHASLMVKLVLFGFLLLSVLSWGVMFYKHYHLRRAAQESAAFMEAFESGVPLPKLAEMAKTLPASPLAGVFLHVMTLKGDMPADRLRTSWARYDTIRARHTGAWHIRDRHIRDKQS